ncbi:Bardet-Biedl syndrome 5 protein homolog [Rhagoletis pomonella]|uniref:Bardet-Biedl syndrome 5 protein homolog n=1 Tax=Rhagoletis pomonella TaxID=28610 RepID=UPI00177DB159|nr:Bardet-Biedl syndrome 5 protein homolog [Rhagoletis pomonella]
MTWTASEENLLWEDKEIKFDTPNIQNHLRNGENVLDTIYHIEDTKGNPGDTGRLLATNLRIIWYSLSHKKYNLSIGYARFVNTNTRSVVPKVGGPTQALYILATGSNTRFEFLFTDVSGDTARRNTPIFQSVFEIYQLYQRTYLYRDLKLRGAIVLSGQLIIMPDELVYNNVNGVWNLSSDQGNLGSFVVTNIRLVWFADANDTFNISLPYLQIANIRIRESKYGPALVIQTAETGGGYVLGFRIDPVERLNEIYKELISLHAIYSENPNFGVRYDSAEAQKRLASMKEAEEFKPDEFLEIDERQEREVNTKLNTYLAEGTAITGTEAPTREPVYCKELGFAMERIRDGYKLQDLWDVLPRVEGE